MAPKTGRAFDAETFLNSSGVARRPAAYAPAAVIFAQGNSRRHRSLHSAGEGQAVGAVPGWERGGRGGIWSLATSSVRGRSPASRFAWRRRPR